MLIPRRAFLVGVPAGFMGVPAGLMAAESVLAGSDADESARGAAPGAVYHEFPSQDPALVRNVVGLSHFDLDGVRELVSDRPALAKASWDWGFGDWESALGAASHVGRRDIVEVLMSHGARPNLFTFAMLDQVDVVRAAVEANPGVQKTHGPHGITLLAHARFGKAQRVVDYLEHVGDADVPQRNEPLEAGANALYVGTYSFQPGSDGVLSVVEMKSGALAVHRGESAPRQLLHLGDHTFYPTGAPAARIAFRMSDGGAAETLTVHDADLVVTARKR